MAIMTTPSSNSNNNDTIRYKKGSVIKEQSPYFIRSLNAKNDEHQLAPLFTSSTLPRYPCCRNNDKQNLTSNKTMEFYKQHCQTVDNGYSLQAVVVCLELLLVHQNDTDTTVSALSLMNESTNETNVPQPASVLSDEEQELLLEAWTLVQHDISYKDWLPLYLVVRRDLRILQVPSMDPEYCLKTVFELSSDQVQQACQVLVKSKLVPSTIPCNNHALSQALLELPPTTRLVLVDSPFSTTTRSMQTITTSRHSCLPNMVLEYNSTLQKLQWIALYDIKHDESLSEYLAVEKTSHNEKAQRQDALQHKFGPKYTCDCPKCAFHDTSDSLSMTTLLRLGHDSLVREQYEEARTWYRKVLILAQDKNSSLDAWHALGATYLQQGHFLQAQQIWKQAPVSQREQHQGISLQVEKQHAYHYFDKNRAGTNKYENNTDTTTTLQLPSYTDLFGSGLCFVTDTPVLSHTDCQQVIQWAESCPQNWTTSRHYAVPTNDVPIHTVAPLLKWFTTWMDTAIYRLLQDQFQLQPNTLFVHDAFVVRYSSQRKSNHLPMHFDESTHSLVLTLNEEFQGGGTYFIDQDTLVNPKQAGTLVSFRGDLLKHGGEVVTSGVRYILAVFLYHDNEELRFDDSEDGLNVNKDTAIPAKRARAYNWESSKESGFLFGFAL